MPFYLSCGNCHQRNPDRRNQKHGALELAYVIAWRMMGFAYHVRYSMITDRAPVPPGLGPLIKTLDASDVCAWNCLLLHGRAIDEGNDVSKIVMNGALRTIERVYEIEEPNRQFAQHLNLPALRTDTVMTQDRLCDLIKNSQANDMDEKGLAPLLDWYQSQDWFDHFAAKLNRSLMLPANAK